VQIRRFHPAAVRQEGLPELVGPHSARPQPFQLLLAERGEIQALHCELLHHCMPYLGHQDRGRVSGHGVPGDRPPLRTGNRQAGMRVSSGVVSR